MGTEPFSRRGLFRGLAGLIASRWYKPKKTLFVFPQIRRVFPALIANEIVSVQPMTMPSGLLFYLDYRYTTKEKS